MEFSDYTGQSLNSGPKIFKFFIIIIFTTLILGCERNEKGITHQEGELSIYADESNENLLIALTEMYSAKFPKVKFNIVKTPENVILKDFQDTLINAAFTNKPLTKQQTQYLTQETKIKPKSILLAYDAAIFITSLENPQDSISLEEIKNGILEEKSKIIFDNGNSGNFNTVKEVLKFQLKKGQTIQALNDSKSVIEFLQRNKNAVGVIGFNVISEKYNPEVKEILSKVKVLPVIDENNISQEPTIENILEFGYPFYKGVYFLIREAGFGIGSGFARFSGSEQGQLIVKREGLQPNYLYKREIQINQK